MKSTLCEVPAKYLLQLKGRSDMPVCETCASEIQESSDFIAESLVLLSGTDANLNMKCQNRLEVKDD